MLGYRGAIIIPVSAMILASLILNRPYVFAALAGILLPVLLWDVMRRTRLVRMPAEPVRFRIRVRNLKADALASVFRPVLDWSPVQRARDRIEQNLRPHILRSGSAQNPRILGGRSVLYPLAAGVVTVPAGIILALALDAAFLAMSLVWPLLAGVYFVILRIRTAERSSDTTEELASFAILAGIMESVNVPMFSTLLILAESPSAVFAVMRREGRRIRNLMVLGRSPTDALLELSDSHPNTEFRDFVTGYVSAFNTGGSDTAGYLHEQANRFFRQVQFRMVSYARQADIISQVVLTVMMLLPMMGLSMTFFSSGHLAGTMTLLMIAVFPFATAVMVAFVHAKQPRGRDRIRVSWMVFPTGACCAAAVYLAGMQAWEAAGAGVVASSLLNHVLTRRRFAEIRGIDMALPEFMRRLTRLRNVGFDMVRAIKTVRAEAAAREKGGGAFYAMLDGICRRVSAGGSLGDAVGSADIASWNARLVFFILGRINESGGGTAKTTSDLAYWIAQYHEARREMISSLRSSLVTALVGPVLMVMMMTVSDRLAATLGDGLLPDAGGLPVSIAVSADPSGLSELLIVTAVACMGVILSKINYFTIRHSLFTGMITGATMAMMYAVPYLPDFGF